MKKLFIAVLALSSVTAHAAPFLECEANTDPDQLSVDLYRGSNGNLVAYIADQVGDGDSGGEDVIELKRMMDFNPAIQTYIQVESARPNMDGVKLKPTHKTSGFVLKMSPSTPNMIKVKAAKDPSGSTNIDTIELECSKPKATDFRNKWTPRI